MIRFPTRNTHVHNILMPFMALFEWTQCTNCNCQVFHIARSQTQTKERARIIYISCPPHMRAHRKRATQMSFTHVYRSLHTHTHTHMSACSTLESTITHNAPSSASNAIWPYSTHAPHTGQSGISGRSNAHPCLDSCPITDCTRDPRHHQTARTVWLADMPPDRRVAITARCV